MHAHMYFPLTLFSFPLLFFRRFSLRAEEPVAIVMNRLRQLFLHAGVENAKDLFAPFDRWCALHATLTPSEAARKRVGVIEAGFHTIRASNPGIEQLSLMVGYFIDLHIPLLLKPNIQKVFQVYRRNLAPEQSVGFPLLVGGPKELQHKIEKKLHHIILKMLKADGISGPSTSAAVKLFAKGRPNPNSVRYVRPLIEEDLLLVGATHTTLTCVSFQVHTTPVAKVPGRVRRNRRDRFVSVESDRTPIIRPRQSARAVVEKAPALQNRSPRPGRSHGAPAKQIPLQRDRKGHRHNHLKQPSTLALRITKLGVAHGCNLHQTVRVRQPDQHTV
jgi:hypothetical protein